jgi:nitrogenase-associated protein
MATIHFWEKPGCQTHARQKAALRAAGHEVVAHDLFHEHWTPMRLLDFFIDLPIADWFNPAAPQVKSGEITPDLFDTTSALQAMIAEPLLIRRPLLEVGSARVVGFDSQQVAALTGAVTLQTPQPQTHFRANAPTKPKHQAH